MNKRSAISAINRHGILLVYPMKNKSDVLSLWSVFYPDEEMLWEWTDDGDDRVANLWHLRMKLSESTQVVYAKYFQGRATFFSREVFVALLCLMKTSEFKKKKLTHESKKIMQLLDQNSPISTKRIKKETDLKGKFFEATYMRALKVLWAKLLIVGFGEVDDGAFPSLAVGSSELLFEDLWKEALLADENASRAFLLKKLSKQPAFLNWIQKSL
ncbi:MAG: hypothetical protein R3A80_13540 [Bdellovibrionota bacterium]